MPCIAEPIIYLEYVTKNELFYSENAVHYDIVTLNASNEFYIDEKQSKKDAR